MRREGFSVKDVTFRRTLYMRYTRQVNEVAVQIPGGRFEKGDRVRIESAFNAKYEEMYGAGAGHAEAGVEVISIAVDAIGATVKPTLLAHPIVGPDGTHARKGTRRAYFTGKNPGYRDATIYDYTKLQPGNIVNGPSIIETPFTTVVVPEGRVAEVDQYLNIVLRR
jgi:N-methylhydantoinase A/oxoprolinase/acetone carboxylase beta subunit